MLKNQKLLGILICFVFLILCLSIEIFNRNSNPDRYKVWNEDSILKAEDFMGQPPFYGGRQAEIFYRARVITSPEIRVVIEIDKFKSNIKKNRISEKLIKHEAYHLKLAYALLADVNEQILKKNLSVDEANQLTLSRWDLIQEYQKLYDKKSNHSLIEAQQNYWEYKIDSILNKSIDFQYFKDTEKIKVYFPDKPNDFVLSFNDEYFKGYRLEKYDVKFWIVDLEIFLTDTLIIEDIWIYTLGGEGHSKIVVNRNYPHGKSIFESYSQDTIAKEIVLDKLLLGENSTYWLRNRYPMTQENEELYRRMGEQFFNSFEVIDE